MKHLGMIIFIVGLGLGTSFAARVEPADVPEGQVATGTQRLTAWAGVAALPFLGGLGLMIAGAMVARRAGRAERLRRKAERENSNEATPEALLARIEEKLHALPVGHPEGVTEHISKTLDDVLEEDVPAFLDHREDLIDKLGVAGFAEMIGHFASMERNTARAWSALTDEVLDEVGPCVERACSEITLAVAALKTHS